MLSLSFLPADRNRDKIWTYPATPTMFVTIQLMLWIPRDLHVQFVRDIFVNANITAKTMPISVTLLIQRTP